MRREAAAGGDDGIKTLRDEGVVTEDPVGVSRRGEDGEDEQPRQHDDGGGGLGGGLADEREGEGD